MDISQAHDFAHKAIKNYCDFYKIAYSTSTPKSASDPDFKHPTKLPKDQWIIFNFTPENEKQSDELHNLRDFLNKFGIKFDSCGGCGGWDWFLDWSFECQEYFETVNVVD